MGSHGRSIRLRIYFLVAIPLITMLGLFGYVAYISVTSWLNLDRAPSLIKATSIPITKFVNILQGERRAAVVYLSQPNTANLNAYQNAIMATKNAELPFQAAVTSPETRSNATADETAAIGTMLSDLAGIAKVRGAVIAKMLPPLDAFGAYTKVITDQDTVFQAEAGSITNATAASQGLGLIASVNAREAMFEQDVVLAGALASGAITPQDRVVFSLAAGRQQDDTALYTALFTPAERAAFNAPLATPQMKTLLANLTQVQQGVAGGATLAQMEQQGLTPAAWQELNTAIGNANYQGGLKAADVDLANVQQISQDAKDRVKVTAGIGLVGLLLTLIVTILLGRSINRRLTALSRSARTLAEDQLPSVVARLRRGESVDVAAEAPPLRVGDDEIGQVGQAIDLVRQTALRSAVEEARLRQGVNDMFRNLARRSQSLLQRQLTVLDGMERRATDPDVLEDLFRMDHLTTRMRRHAEGLIILSGAPPGRGWSAPVRLIDVMRGAVAEVEDYARVVVSTQSKASLAGPAVTDAIHLLAELIENATTLSPPFTQVRVSGEMVGNGFAIEVEDRGLGMTPARLAELNERLASPPDINPANTEQLGLFVVGQLARRHGITVTLRPSPYGGTTAVALIPRQLIVDEGPAAITTGGPEAASVGGPARPRASYGSPEGYDGSYASSYGSYGATRAGAGFGGNGSSSYPYGGDVAGPALPSFTPTAPAGSPPDLDNLPLGQGTYGHNQASPAGSGIRISGALRHSAAAASGGNGVGTSPGGTSPGARRGGRHGTSEVPVVTGVPVTRPTAPPGPSFDVFTPLRRPEQGAGGPPGDAIPGDAIPGVADPGGAVDAPYAESYQDPFAGSSPAQGSYAETTYAETSQAETSYGGGSYGNNAGDGDGYQQGDLTGGSGDYKGLPRRVRQANLAPELRSSAAAGSDGPAGVPQASTASLADMRNTLSAMQRGWQQGRSQPQQDTEDGIDGD
jgi:signal transduction histidine kinase